MQLAAFSHWFAGGVLALDQTSTETLTLLLTTLQVPVITHLTNTQHRSEMTTHHLKKFSDMSAQAPPNRVPTNR